MSITQQALISAEPAEVYAILADASALSALSGMGGVPGHSAGEEFSAFDGHVTGRHNELGPGERVVQAWRFPQWAPGDVLDGQLHPGRRGRRDPPGHRSAR